MKASILSSVNLLARKSISYKTLFVFRESRKFKADIVVNLFFYNDIKLSLGAVLNDSASTSTPASSKLHYPKSRLVNAESPDDNIVPNALNPSVFGIGPL
jgi:hypothetical protein